MTPATRWANVSLAHRRGGRSDGDVAEPELSLAVARRRKRDGALGLPLDVASLLL
jgi:hypothetical protein